MYETSAAASDGCVRVSFGASGVERVYERGEEVMRARVGVWRLSTSMVSVPLKKRKARFSITVMDGIAPNETDDPALPGQV